MAGADPAGSRHVARSDTGAGRHVGEWPCSSVPHRSTTPRPSSGGDGDRSLALSRRAKARKKGRRKAPHTPPPAREKSR